MKETLKLKSKRTVVVDISEPKKVYRLKLIDNGLPTELKTETIEEMVEALHQLAVNIEHGWKQGPVFAKLGYHLCGFGISHEEVSNEQ